MENAERAHLARISYAPGATSIIHQHPDAIAIMLADAKVKFAMADGKQSQDQEMANESATYTPAGTHTPTNIGTGPIKGIWSSSRLRRQARPRCRRPART